MSEDTQESAVTAVAEPAPKPKRKGYWAQFRGNFLWVSIAVHALLFLVAAYLVVSTITARPKPEFKAGPKGNPGVKQLEHKVQMVKQKNTMSAPPQSKRIATTGKSAVVLPDLPTIATSDEFNPSQMASMNPGATGFAPAAMGGGGAGGGGPSINFFGLQSKGNRIAFLLDYSGTMSGERQKALNEEFDKALKKLPDTAEIMVILWSGHAWMLGEDPRETMKSWKMITNRQFELTPSVKDPQWTKLTSANRKKIEKQLQEAKIWSGFTDLRAPWLWLAKAKPAPDVVFFLTDGQRDPAMKPEDFMQEVARNVKKLPPQMVTNVVAVKAQKEWEEDLKYLARRINAKLKVLE